jgi:hypothetical protein
MDSKSKGTFFHEHIKDRFQYQRVETSNLKSKKHPNNKEVSTMNQNPCPKCGIIPNIEDVESVFGMRQSGGRSIRQSYCKKCRSSPLPVANNLVENDEKESRKERLRKIKEKRLLKEAEIAEEREQRGREIEEEEEQVEQKNKKEELRELHDEIEKKERELKEVEKEAEKEAEDLNEKIEQNKPKFTSKEVRDFIKSRDNVSDADREMLDEVIELANQFPDETLLRIYENRYITEETSERVEEDQRRMERQNK